MNRAIELALKGEGRTSPNPIVGAVVVKNSRIVGEGYHRRAGYPHAEIEAIRNAGAKARGADLYVTLEPCCHFGRTPPCCNAIIKSQIKHVIIGMCDPNPIVNGMGIKFLRNNGLKITEGVMKNECRQINLPYVKWIVSGIPYVTLKAGLSLDGKIATSNGESKWITNKKCRQYVYKLRSLSDAVLVGIGTVLKDNPRLRKAKKVVILDPALKIPLSSQILKRKKNQLIITTTNKSSVQKRIRLEKMGHRVMLCRSTSDGRIFLPHLLFMLGKDGIVSLFVEGGGMVSADFMRRNLVDRIIACIAPKIIGGTGYNWLPEVSFKNLKATPTLHDVTIRLFGDNIVVEGVVHSTVKKS